MAMNIKVARFETSPIDVPVGYEVSFIVEVTNAQGVALGSFVRGTLVPIAECVGLTDLAICNLAWGYCKKAINAQKAAIKARNPIIGTVFTPPV